MKVMEPIDILLSLLSDMHAICHQHKDPIKELEEIHKLVHQMRDIEPSGRGDYKRLREILLSSKKD